MGRRGNAGRGWAALSPWQLLRIHDHLLVQVLPGHLSGWFGLFGEDWRPGAGRVAGKAINVIVAVGLWRAVCPSCLLG